MRVCVGGPSPLVVVVGGHRVVQYVIINWDYRLSWLNAEAQRPRSREPAASEPSTISQTISSLSSSPNPSDNKSLTS